MTHLEGSAVTPVVAAAHELKSPLALMRQLAILLADESMPFSQREQLRQQLVLTSERALRLTGDLTKSARLEDALFEMEPINSEQLCRDVIAELGPLFDAHQRTLKVKGGRHPLLLVANRDLLQRILMNFSDNALQYAEPGTAVELQIKAFRKARKVRIGVRDYGPALSADMWRQLQSRLAKAPQAIHARPESSGLGLYIAGLFAEAMNGEIGAVRHRDGATFYVELPASHQLQLL